MCSSIAPLSMLAFVLRRLVQAVLVMLTVAFIAFMLFQYVGDPVTNILGQDATPQQRAAAAQPISASTSRSRSSSRASSATPSGANSASACARGARSRR